VATTRKTAQTPKAPAQTDTKPAVPALNFSNLTVTNVEPAAIKHTRKSKLEDSPVLDWLRDSKANDQAKSVTVDNEAQATTLVNTIRQAAARLEIGVAVKVVPAGDDKVAVNFKAKDKAKRPVKTETAKAE
jgi:hypothetical protein